MPFVWEIADDFGTVHIEIKAFKTLGICLCAEHCVEDLHSHIETNGANQAGRTLFSRYVNGACVVACVMLFNDSIFLGFILFINYVDSMYMPQSFDGVSILLA